MPLNLRKPHASEMEELFELDRLCFQQQGHLRSFQKELQSSMSRLYVAHYEDPLGYHPSQLVGYALCWAIQEDWELLNIATSPNFRKRGFGKKLLQSVLDSAKKEQAKHLYLEVRESNRIAINLYQQMDGQEVGRRKKYYTNPVEDALLFTFFFNSLSKGTP